VRVEKDGIDEIVGETVGGREDPRRQPLRMSERGTSQQKEDRQINDPRARHDGPDCNARHDQVVERPFMYCSRKKL